MALVSTGPAGCGAFRDMILSTPFSLLSNHTKRRLISLVSCAVHDAFVLDSSLLRVVKIPVIRAASVIPRACHLCPTVATLEAALQYYGLPVSEESLGTLCEATANAVILRHTTLPPPIDQTGLKLVTWNLTALSPLEDSYKKKLLKKLVSNKIVCLQETKMSMEDARLLELQLPGCRVVSTPAVSLEDTDDANDSLAETDLVPKATAALSGGVAILLPIYLCATNCTQRDLIPGYAVAVTIAHKSFQWCIVYRFCLSAFWV